MEQLVDKIDCFIKEYDSNEYADQVPDREVHLQQLVLTLNRGSGIFAILLSEYRGRIQ